jgi:hypothetical protein
LLPFLLLDKEESVGYYPKKEKKKELLWANTHQSVQIPLCVKWLSIYEAKVVCFVLSCWDLSNHHGTSCHTLGIFGKLLMSKGCIDLVWDYGVEAIDYWIIFLMKIK